MFEEWQLIEVSDTKEPPVKRIYLFTDHKGKYACVKKWYEDAYEKGFKYVISLWVYAWKINDVPPLEVSVEEVAKKFGVNNIKIK